jgi:protein-tyrosine phosphatase
MGNICRSPMAAGLLRQQLPELQIESAGLSALVGHPADPNASELMLARGIPIEAHRARQLVGLHCREADLILVMDEEQRRAIVHEYPFARGRVLRLGQYGGFDIPDPFRQSRERFTECLGLVDQGVAEWVERIRALA